MIFRPESEIQTFFFAHIQVVSKKKKKKKVFTQIESDFRPESEIQTFFRPKSGGLQKKKVFTKLRLIFRRIRYV